MATIKDIAKLAGVSHGTVSNVLNKRGNVSVEKIEAVYQAAKQMGYQLNTQAQLLRANKSHKIAILLPQLVSEKYAVFFNALRQSIAQFSEVTYDLFLTDDLETTELEALQKIAAGGYKQVITVSCLNDANIYFDTLKLSPSHVAFVYRQPLNTQRFFTLDFAQAADAICLQVMHTTGQLVGIFIGSSDYVNNQIFANELQSRLLEYAPNKKSVVLCASDEESYKIAFDFFSMEQIPDIFIAQDSEKARYLTQASYFGSHDDCPPIFALSDNIPPVLKGLYYFPMNYAQLGLEVIDALMQEEETEIIESKVTYVRNQSDHLYTATPTIIASDKHDLSLNLLILPSPSTSALKKLLPHFYRQTGIKVNLAIHPYDEVYQILSQLHLHPYYDLLRIDMACFPWFAERILQPLDKIGNGLTDLLNNFSLPTQQKFSLVNNVAYAMPFDASAQLLFYRKDLFEDPILKRMYYEKTGNELTVPTTFEEYDNVTQFFTQLHEEGQISRPMGASTTLGSAGLIATEYLLRYYAKEGRLIGSDNIPQLAMPLAGEVLKEYLQQLSITENIYNKWWSESVRQFEQGHLAMLVSYMNLFNDVAHSNILPKTGFAPVPGGIPQLGGGVLAVSRYSQKSQYAEQFYRWLYSPMVMDHLILLGGNSNHQNFSHNQEISHRYPWMTLAYQEINKGIRESSIPNGKLFNLRQAEIIIGQGITNVVNNIMTIDETIEYINQRLLIDTQGER
ncbi:LacI-family transcriptional regulator [Proteus vulgaris]|jgi:DNA-binding LacI/PurR family transcriptional regulator/ABC-type glycerol-3-phosphate transport system substrate-binding protein|uniref:LacI-family transcriptional regulator n=1 Tax=Proteus vulgaris TaxID=585 RepID=A0A379F9J9_PROVU|nr:MULTISPECIES: extracellular solute-binding protein [Proteus]MCH4255052.1 extracellular solute-binding protein [Proteus vulgaris]NBN46154.1 extracellular solute-binding protein [Proteus sp. G2626]SUC16112.1 LacI-family transcriptional regulator [Proteus vulgaris]